MDSYSVTDWGLTKTNQTKQKRYKFIKNIVLKLYVLIFLLFNHIYLDL